MNNLLYSSLEKNKKLIENAIEDYYSRFGDNDTEEVRVAEMYSLMAGGKRIRPFLVNEFCRIFGGEEKASLDFALAVEMMHTFSLIHDDLPCMDDDDLRRGRATSHKVFGEATALLAGDSLAIRSIEVALSNKYVAPAVAAKAATLLARAAGSEGMIGGQIIDMRGEIEQLDFDLLIKLHSKKTGALIKASVALGCYAAGLSDTDLEFVVAQLYAERIGLAFQIVDDILDTTSSDEILGKSIGSDADNNKTTFLTYMTIEEAREYAIRLTEEAKAAISEYNGSETLCELADYLIVRSF
jgi:geranylgeranyl diphosphate synthase type II